MRKRRVKKGAKDRVRRKGKTSKLKEIALSKSNTYSERMRAINLLGQLREDAFDDLSEIATRGLTYAERMSAMDMLEIIIKKGTD